MFLACLTYLSMPEVDGETLGEKLPFIAFHEDKHVLRKDVTGVDHLPHIWQLTCRDLHPVEPTSAAGYGDASRTNLTSSLLERRSSC